MLFYNPSELSLAVLVPFFSGDKCSKAEVVIARSGNNSWKSRTSVSSNELHAWNSVLAFYGCYPSELFHKADDWLVKAVVVLIVGLGFYRK